MQHIFYEQRLKNKLIGPFCAGIGFFFFCPCVFVHDKWQLNDILCIIQGGSVVRLFHKELEAYMVAEGLFDDEVTEDGTN